MRTNQDLYSIFIHCKSLCDECNVPYDKRSYIKFDKMNMNTYGTCSLEHEIRINDFYKNEEVPEYYLRRTILHELCHTVEGCFNHGQKWQSQVTKINRKFCYDIKRLSKVDAVTREAIIKIKKPKYIFECDGCGLTVAKQRMCGLVKHPEEYTCRICGGHFSLVE